MKISKIKNIAYKLVCIVLFPIILLLSFFDKDFWSSVFRPAPKDHDKII